jgi:capsule polysaccharide export protein KpsE/RkpR
MREFQEEHQIVDLDTQAKAVVSAMAALNSQRIGKQLELDYARTFSSRDEATTQQLESQLSVMNQKLRDLEEASAPQPEAVQKRDGSGKGASRGVFPAALAVPKLRAEFEKLYRDRKVTETSLVFALERLEGAKAAEARNVSTFQVLDPPALPTRHSRPKRSVVLVASILIGLVASLLLEHRRSPILRTASSGQSLRGGAPERSGTSRVA